jgi:phospholipase C
MEAGTNAPTDHTFSTDNDASAANSTTSTAHLSTQVTAAGLTWMSYQQGIASGTCPITSSAFGSGAYYAAKHDPFVFFQDVSGATPAVDNAGCGAHHKSTDDLAGDLASGAIANYVFITPDLCNDMHGDIQCPSGISTNTNIKAGDDWASTNVPALIAYTHTHDAIIFLVWDEGDNTNLMPFIAIGDHVKKGPDTTTYNHGSQVKSIETFLGLPTLPSVANVADFSAMFEPGYLATP